MLSFNLNQKKETGVKELNVQGKKLIEAVESGVIGNGGVVYGDLSESGE